MLATKEVARKAVAGELSIGLDHQDLGYRMMSDVAAAEICAPPASRWTARQSVTRLLTLDYCVATTNGSRKNTFAVRWPLCPAENEQAQVTGFNESVEETVSDSCSRSAHHNLSVINHREISEK